MSIRKKQTPKQRIAELERALTRSIRKLDRQIEYVQMVESELSKERAFMARILNAATELQGLASTIKHHVDSSNRYA